MIESWGAMPKNATDTTLIDEEIDAKIASHNNDPDAHMATDEVLDIHRASSVIDHPAESVVNDKIQISARAYVAIVDPDDENAFDTIEGAIAYAITCGGGNIFIKSGNHYFSDAIEMPANINLIGEDNETTIIHGDLSSTEYLLLTNDTVTDQKNVLFKNLQFYNDGTGVLVREYNDGTTINNYIFENCKFKNGGEYLRGLFANWQFINCEFELTNEEALKLHLDIIINNCTITKKSGATTVKFIGQEPTDSDSITVKFINSDLQCVSATSVEYVVCLTEVSIYAINSWFLDWNTTNLSPFIIDITGGFLDLYTGDDLNNDNGITQIRLFGVRVTGGATPCIVFTLSDNVCVGCYLEQLVDIQSDGNLVEANTYPLQYNTASTSATALELATYKTVYLAPTSTRTLTTTVPPAGEIRQLILFQSNTTAKTMTFGSGFKTTGTLALGTTANRYFTLIFVSDGSKLIQIARSTAIA